MSVNSRQKGKRGEREAAKALGEALGLTCRRAQQYSGLGSADVVGVDGLHIEVKRTETFRIHDAVAQASADAANGDVPLVLHKKNGKPWLAIVKVEDLPQLSRRVIANLVQAEC